VFLTRDFFTEPYHRPVRFANGGFAKIIFPDSVELIARAPFPRDYYMDRMSPELATIMLFVRRHLGIFAPRLMAWVVIQESPVGAPYLLVEAYRISYFVK
jgi:hypothetical protein